MGGAGFGMDSSFFTIGFGGTDGPAPVSVGRSDLEKDTMAGSDGVGFVGAECEVVFGGSFGVNLRSRTSWPLMV